MLDREERIMIQAEYSRQLMIRVGDHLGTLAEITHDISSSGINFIAMCAYTFEKQVCIMFVTEDNNGARKILEEKGYQVGEEEVILLSIENKVGALKKFTDKIKEAGIQLRLVYGSVSSDAQASRIVLLSEDNTDMMLIIKTILSRG